MKISFLDQWLIRRMGQLGPTGSPTAEQLREWQLDRLREVVTYARENSPFYACHLGQIGDSPLATFEDFSKLPMISPELLRKYPKQLLCVSQDAIERVVTVESSGTTGKPKRIFYSREDLEATRSFFSRGMANLAGPGDTAFVLMPGERPGGVASLLSDSLEAIGVNPVIHGELLDSKKAVDQLLECGAHCIIGPAAHVNMLASEWKKRNMPSDQVRTVLLCWDSTPDAVLENVQDVFDCAVFRHWGMIETGLGGAVECKPGSGLHLREADFYLEIIDPDSGIPLPDGEFGEMVITTLLCNGMPLIRYRTGDRGRILPGECACGNPMRRLDPAIRRLGQGVDVGTGYLRLEDLNEALYGMPEVEDFVASLESGVLSILVCANGCKVRPRVIRSLEGIPVLKSALKTGVLGLDLRLKKDGAPAVAGLCKRSLQVSAH